MYSDIRRDSPEVMYKRTQGKYSSKMKENEPSGYLDVIKPADLAANNKTMQQIIDKHWNRLIEKKIKIRF